MQMMQVFSAGDAGDAMQMFQERIRFIDITKC